MNEPVEIYVKEIFELAKKAKEGVLLDNPDLIIEKFNLMCGDDVTLSINISEDNKVAIGYQVQGCILCRAATKKLVDLVIRNNKKDKIIEKLAEILIMYESDKYPHGMEIFSAVNDFPARHDCVLLPFKALAEYLSRD